jgi:hypothetical protein
MGHSAGEAVKTSPEWGKEANREQSVEDSGNEYMQAIPKPDGDTIGHRRYAVRLTEKLGQLVL